MTDALEAYYTFLRTYAATQGIRDQDIARQWKDTKRLSPSQLVSTLTEIFLEQETKLRTDLIGLADFCKELLGRVCPLILSTPQMTKEIRGLNNRHFHVLELVYHTLWDAGIAEMRGVERGTDCLRRAASELPTVLSKPGAGTRFLHQKMRLCSQHVPDELQPARRYGDTHIPPPDISAYGISSTSWQDPESTEPCFRVGVGMIEQILHTIPTLDEWIASHGGEPASMQEYQLQVAHYCEKLFVGKFADLPAETQSEMLQRLLTRRRQQGKTASEISLSSGLAWEAV